MIGTEGIVRGPEGIPSRTGSDSVEGAEDIASFRKVKCETSPFRLLHPAEAAVSAGGRHLEMETFRVNPASSARPQLRPVDRKKPKKVAGRP